MKNNKPACVLLSPSQYESLMETLSDYLLLDVAGRRAAANDDNDNISMEAMMEQLGISADDLAGLDVEIE